MKRCPKCGAKARRVYHADKYDCHKEWANKSECSDEHLHMVCETCAYDWCEPTLDAKEARP
jgi:hypothetical protein